MSDVELLIKVPEDLYKAAVNGLVAANEIWDLKLAVANGTLLPKGHGDLKDINDLEECKEMMKTFMREYRYAVLMSDIRNVPTIIEADKTIDCNNDGWCNTCEYKHCEFKCVGCAKYDEYDNLITLSKYKIDKYKEDT